MQEFPRSQGSSSGLPCLPRRAAFGRRHCGGTNMIPVRNILTSAILGLSLSIAGCQNDGHGNTNTAGQVSQAQLPPPKTMNQVSAQEKLKEAEQAETEGK